MHINRTALSPGHWTTHRLRCVPHTVCCTAYASDFGWVKVYKPLSCAEGFSAVGRSSDWIHSSLVDNIKVSCNEALQTCMSTGPIVASDWRRNQICQASTMDIWPFGGFWNDWTTVFDHLCNDWGEHTEGKCVARPRNMLRFKVYLLPSVWCLKAEVANWWTVLFFPPPPVKHGIRRNSEWCRHRCSPRGLPR